MSVKPAQRTESEAMIERLLAVEDLCAQQALVKKHPATDWGDVVNQLTERVWKEVRVDSAKARHLADIAVNVAEAIDDRLAVARSLRAKANTLYVLDQHSAAIALHERAATLFEAVGDDGELARTLSGSIQPLLLLGRYDEALAAGERARTIFASAGNSHRLARLEINIGNIYHRQDRFEEALACYERAYHELLHHDDPEGLAAVLSNLSLCYISLSQFSKALEVYGLARRHCEQKNMPILVAYADYNIAYLYFLRGEYGRAIQMLRDASQSAKKADDAYQLTLCNLDLAEIYIELNLATEAADLARKAHEGFQQLQLAYEAAKALAFAAIAVSRLGQAFHALELFAEAKKLFLREKNQVWPSLIDLYQALVLFNQGRLFEARRLSSEAHEFFRHSAMGTKAVLAELLLGRIALQMNDTAEAEEHCQAALQHLVDLESPMLLYQAEFLMGEVRKATGHEHLAYECYRRSREALETLRGSLRGEELKIAFFQNKLEVYENLVDICVRQPHGFEDAFAHIQQAKSRSLMDLLVRPVHVPAESDAGQSALVRSIRNLREELNWYYNLIEREQLRPEERSQERIQKLERQARAHESELMRAVEEASAAELTSAGMIAPNHIALDAIRSALRPDTALLEYFTIQDRHIVCLLTRDDLQICPVTLQSRIKKILNLLQFQLSKFRLDPQYVNTYQASMLESTHTHLKGLYQELIAPVRDLLRVPHLVFAPHGLLHYVPFHALHDGESYLIDRFSVSYAPSAGIYAFCQAKQANTSGPSLILGVPDTQAPFIRDEVEALASILPDARLFTGSAATEEVLRTHAGSSRLVHIATHGYFRQDNPMFSSIRLGDSYLSLYDLYHLKLPAELVVLSGCATGLNLVTPGDELIGLVRGLLQAGAQSLVLSLWDVHDQSTREFMISFYKHLVAGLAKPAALQAAMAGLRDRYPHPYYWAPFVLIGKG